MERDGFNQMINDRAKISTHTLTWSVTIACGYCLYISFDFNSHAHVERDFEYYYRMNQIENFNSHAHVERDYIA